MKLTIPNPSLKSGLAGAKSSPHRVIPKSRGSDESLTENPDGRLLMPLGFLLSFFSTGWLLFGFAEGHYLCLSV